MTDLGKIICVSNRLPISASEGSGLLEFQPSSGGLVTAIAPFLRKARGAWIGWPGSITSTEEQIKIALARFSAESEFALHPVILDQDSVSKFYQGFSNQLIWPLFHDLQSKCNFDPDYWSTYLEVQKLFSAETVKHIKPADLIWIHDYHLMGLGRMLREEGVNNKICFFFHTPFPGRDIFLKLPWRSDVMDSMMSYDLIGVQTRRDLENFTDCLEYLTGNRSVQKGTSVTARCASRDCTIGSFPISIDFNEFEEIARSPEVESNALRIRNDMNTEYLVLSIDRLDYTKGIPYRIRAFRRLLEKEPSLKKRITLLQVVVPSRVEVSEYQQLRSEIEQLVSQLNGEFGEPGWVPVHHLFRSLTREDVIAMYRASDIALVTPLKDGMNLVAKEYCASRISNGGALVLSEFAGAAQELAEFAFIVNPYDIDGVAQALKNAFETAKSDAKERMRLMREAVRKNDVYGWASSFLNAAHWEWPSYDLAPRPATIWDRLKRITKVFDF